MSRDLHPDVQTAIDGRAVRPRLFAEFDFAGGFLRVHSGTGNVPFQGETYLGLGTLGGVSPVGETIDAKALGVVFQLSGIPSAVIGAALNENYQGRPAKLWLVLVDADEVVIGDPTLIFAGRMDTMPIGLSGETSQVQLTAESHLADLRKAIGTMMTAGEQKIDYPDDLGLDYIEKIIDKEFIWGGAKVRLSFGERYGLRFTGRPLG